MQKSNLKSKKTSLILTAVNDFHNQTVAQSPETQFVEVGAICGDGTFTQYTGRGAGSHHNGIRHKLYAKITQLCPPQKSLSSKTTSTLTFHSEQTNLSKDSHQSNPTSPPTQKKKKKKISLKETFKTKTKKSFLYQRIHQIFQILYKDPLPIIEEQLDDGLWLIVAAVCNLHDELEQSATLIKSLESSFTEGIKKQAFQQKEYGNEVETLARQIKTLAKDNQSLNKEIQKLSKTNAQLGQELEEHRLRQGNFKRMLRVIERQNPKMLSIAVEQSRIDVRDLKKKKAPESGLMTRSMVKKQHCKRQDVKMESLFSSDQQTRGYDEDHTIVGLIRSMK